MADDSQTTSNGGGSNDRVPKFSGKAEEFPEWSFVAEQWFKRHAGIRPALDEATSRLTTIVFSELSETNQDYAQKLATDLAMTCIGPARRFLMNCKERSNGFEMWRLMCRQYKG